MVLVSMAIHFCCKCFAIRSNPKKKRKRTTEQATAVFEVNERQASIHLERTYTESVFEKRVARHEWPSHYVLLFFFSSTIRLLKWV